MIRKAYFLMLAVSVRILAPGAPVVADPASMHAAPLGFGSSCEHSWLTLHRGVRPVALPPLPGDMNSEGRGINSFGVVVGSSRGFDHAAAVIWNLLGEPRELPPLPGHHGAEAHAINDHGEVAGISQGAGSTAVLWDQQGTPTPLLPLAGDAESVARGINDHGQVAGFSVRRSGVASDVGGVHLTPVVWDRHGTATPLPLPPGAIEAVALGINWRGDVVGFSFSPDYVDSVVAWSPSGTARSLPVLGHDTRSEGHAINILGRVAGHSGDGAGDVAAVWNRPPQRRLPLAGDSGSEALAINTKGETAGWSVGPAGSTGVAWSAYGRSTPLLPLAGDTESQAYAMNDVGQVAGLSVGAAGHRAVVWDMRACQGL